MFDEPDSTYDFNVSESAPTGTLVGQVSAMDDDEDDTVEYSITGGGEAGKFDIDSSTGQITVVGSLDYDTDSSYALTVEASDDRGGTGTATVNIYVQPIVTAPGVPENMRVSSGDEILTITWSQPSNTGDSAIVDYRVRYGLIGEPVDDWTQSGALPIGSTKGYTITGLANGMTYGVQLNASNGVHTGAWSTPPVEGTPDTLPGAPEISSVVPGDEELTITWTEPENRGSAITRYDIEYSAAKSGTPTTVGTGTATTATISGDLMNGFGYTIRVRAVNGAGKGEWSAPEEGMPRTTPHPPQITNVTSGNQSLIVEWEQLGDNGGANISSYEIEYTEPPLTPSQVWTSATGVGLPAGLEFRIGPRVSPLTNDTRYLVRIRAVNAAGQGEWSANREGTPRDLASYPTELQLTSTLFDSVNLSWKAPANPGATGYHILRKLAGPEQFQPLRNSNGDEITVEETFYTDDDGLQPDLVYRYKTQAIYGIGGVVGRTKSIETGEITTQPLKELIQPPNEAANCLLTNRPIERVQSSEVDVYTEDGSLRIGIARAEIWVSEFPDAASLYGDNCFAARFVSEAVQGVHNAAWSGNVYLRQTTVREEFDVGQLEDADFNTGSMLQLFQYYPHEIQLGEQPILTVSEVSCENCKAGAVQSANETTNKAYFKHNVVHIIGSHSFILNGETYSVTTTASWRVRPDLFLVTTPSSFVASHFLAEVGGDFTNDELQLLTDWIYENWPD